ncbi:sensor histidine kinase [Pelagicoccus enzymogenes]|nr:HAMP domain-containing sensor histidine kinase [Pelagicoccus enzymogenes]
MACGEAAQAQDPAKRVLAIGPYAEDVPFQAGFMAGLAEGLGAETVLYREYLSYPTFSGASHEANFERYLREKYVEPLDLLVLFGDGATRWGERFRAFHPEAKRLNLVSSVELERKRAEQDVSGYVLLPEQNFAEALDFICSVDPGTKIRVVHDELSDGSENSGELLEVAAKQLGVWERLDFIGGSFGEIREQLEALPQGSPVVLTPYFRGRGGEPAVPAVTMPHLIEGLDLKFYTMWDTLMLEGVLGGKIMISREVGRMAAAQGLRLLRGDALLPADAYGAGLYAFAFDDRLLRRFGMEESLLPAGSVLLNHRPKFLESYFWQSLLVASICAGLLVSTLVLRAVVRRRTQELVRRNEELNTTLMQRNRLSDIGRSMTMLAHDLRSPICTIKTCSDLLTGKSEIGVDDEWLVQRMSDSTRKSLSMISDMLDYVRTLEPKIETVSAEEFMGILNSEILPLCDDLEWVSVECRLLGEGDVSLDTVKVSRVVVNLVKNAIEALGQAEVANPVVVVTVEVSSQETSISVSDNGPGVGKEIAEQLFEPFKTSGKRSGTGLGLAIAKEFVQAHDGAISCETERGKTVFVVRIPNRTEGAREKVPREGVSLPS